MYRRRLIAGITWASIMAVFAMGCAFAATGSNSTQTQILDNQNVGKAETVVGDIMADAFRTAMRCDAAFVSAGDLKPLSSPVSAGEIKAGDLTALLMYPGDAVVTMALDGGKIRQALENSVAAYSQPSLSFLQVSGIQLTFDPSRPAGQRVTSATIGGAPIVNEKSYTVAMLNSMAGGALGYWKIWSKRNIVAGASSVTSAAAVESYLKSSTKPDLITQGRISLSK